jgi:hypothetical protein
MSFADRIKCTTSTTGTGALTLASTGVRDASNGDCLAPAERLSSLANRRVPYEIVSGNNFAGGVGSLSSNGLTLTRDARERSWNGSAFALALLSLSGTSTVFITPHACDFSASSIGRTAAIRAGAISG